MKAVKLLSCLSLVAIVTACGASSVHNLGPAVLLQTNIQAVYRVDTVGGGHGSGTVISHGGYLLTATHVVIGHRHLAIAIDAGGPYPETYLANVVFADEDTDAAVIKIDRKFEQTAWIGDPGELRIALPIYSVGYTGEFGQFYHAGTIGALGFDFQDAPGKRIEPRSRNLVLCDLPYDHGDSGGGVFSAETGRMIGFSHAIIDIESGRIYAAVQPVEKIRALLDEYHVPYNEP